MTTQRADAAETRPLDILGISETEERAYRWLLAHPRATAADVARALSLTPSKVQRLLDAIETKGLATRTPERPHRYIPASPDIALKALAAQRHEDLHRAEGAIQEIQEQVASQRHDEREQIVELLMGYEAERLAFEHMQRTANNEIVGLIRPPMLFSRLDIPHEEDQSVSRQALARGVRYRSIIDAEFLKIPGTVEGTRDDIRAGEEVRVFPSLPFKLAIVDRHIGLIPLVLEETHKHIVLLVRLSPLLDALYTLFEILWERAAPLSFTRAGTLKTGAPDSQLPEAAEKLIWLMAAGLNDKKIAYELGISASTLKRRIAQLMKAFNARTRFQLGRLTDRSVPAHDDE